MLFQALNPSLAFFKTIYDDTIHRESPAPFLNRLKSVGNSSTRSDAISDDPSFPAWTHSSAKRPCK